VDFIPAIDLRQGACVRLRQGKMATATKFSDDPPEVARRFADDGARRLHVVDLDGAAAGEPVHLDVVTSIVHAAPALAVQVGGGIRSVSTVRRYLEAGAAYVALGTRAIREPDFLQDVACGFPGSVLLALDAREDRLAVSGWEQATEMTPRQFASTVDTLPLAGIIYTDIARDGMLQGIDVDATLALARQVRTPVIASGGVASVQDIRDLVVAQKRADVCLGGVVCGRALYEGTVDVAAGLRACREALP